MAIKYENELYEPVKNWLFEFLSKSIKPRPQLVKTFIGANETMNKILLREDFSSEIEDLNFFDFKIDVFAVVKFKNRIRLVIIECKKNPIGLIHLGQLIGYSQIINPWISILLSPQGANSNLKRFITIHNHLLRYGREGQISVCGWSITANKLIKVLPEGSLDPISFF